MNEKQKELLDQYDLSILNSFRNKGTFQCETNEGLVLLTQYHSSLRRLAMEYEWKSLLISSGFPQIDQYFLTKEDSLVAYDRYRTSFVLKRYFKGKECDCHNLEDVAVACRNLAQLHNVSESLNEHAPDLPAPRSIEQLFQKRTRELHTIQKYVRRLNRKSNFERFYLSCYAIFESELQTAMTALQQCKDSIDQCSIGVCHGSYHYHNILLLADGSAATLNFESINRQYYLMDLYFFLRKTLEKNHYCYDYFKVGIDSYSTYRTLTPQDYTLLILLFLYPEKFWKLSNQYYNHRKSWISPRIEEKLKKLLLQSEERQDFLQKSIFSLPNMIKYK